MATRVAVLMESNVTFRRLLRAGKVKLNERAIQLKPAKERSNFPSSFALNISGDIRARYRNVLCKRSYSIFFKTPAREKEKGRKKM